MYYISTYFNNTYDFYENRYSRQAYVSIAITNSFIDRHSRNPYLIEHKQIFSK